GRPARRPGGRRVLHEIDGALPSHRRARARRDDLRQPRHLRRATRAAGAGVRCELHPVLVELRRQAAGTGDRLDEALGPPGHAAIPVKPMRVTSIEACLVAVPLRGAFKNAYAVKTVQKSVVVRVKTDAGLEGAGNVDPSPGYSEVTPETILAAIESRLAPAITGADVTNIRAAVARMERAAPGALDAQAAIEMALVDL